MSPRRPYTQSLRLHGAHGGLVLALLGALSAATTTTIASEPVATSAPEERVEFTRDIQPLLQTRCVSCHGPEKRKGGLRLDRRTEALRGGSDHGPAVVPGDSEASPLMKLVTGAGPEQVMPPEGERLSAPEIERLRTWINQGAPWPDAAAPDQDSSLRHWTFQPLIRSAVPVPATSQDRAWCRNPIDAFILDRLQRAGLTPSPMAEARTLLRRLDYNAIGLPPTAEEVDSFAREPSELAYRQRLEELLHSPRHGERWAQHWLDVVRFSETHGFEMNNPRVTAWPYRDYVIRALNEDRPYDRFVREQIAGDALGVDEATGFLVAGPWDQVKSPDVVLTRNQRADELHDLIGTTSSAFLGLTVGCARCHEHKFDPIPQQDYYAIKAVFAGVQHGERPLRAAKTADRQNETRAAEAAVAELDARLSTAFREAALQRARPTPTPPGPPVGARGNGEAFPPVRAARLRFIITATSGAEPCLDELEVFTTETPPRNVAAATLGARMTASGTFPGSDLHRLEHVNDGRFGNSRSWISHESGQGWVEVTFAEPALIDSVVWARDREGRFSDRLPTGYRIEILPAPDGTPSEPTATDPTGGWQEVASSRSRTEPGQGVAAAGEGTEPTRLLAERDTRARRLREATQAPTAYLGQFKDPEPTHRFHRGDPMQPREVVGPGVLSQLGGAAPFPLPGGESTEQQRRLAFADWVVHPGNPLTARVIANRLWQHHFGEGLVSTPSDFGVNGARPSHPELLDWLASELMDNGWSLRHLHRLILLSATFRQSSAARPEGLAADAGTRWLWRYPPRRLEAEAIRDSLLAVCGNLDLRSGGPGWSPFEPNENYVRVYTPRQEYGPDAWRRMVYATHVRQRPDGVFGVFDCPDGGQIAPRRTRSTTPLQALNLLNSMFLWRQAEILAARLEREGGDATGPERPVERAFSLVFQRLPDATERAEARRFVEAHGLPLFCRALLNANEFLYLF